MLQTINSHPRDKLLCFEPSRHAYSSNKCAYLKSVSKVINSLFSPFNADAVISKMMKSEKWPQSKYYQMTPSEIKSLWNSNGKNARNAGTKLHDQIEKYCNNEEFDADEDDAALDQFIAWDQQKQWTPYRTEWKIFDDDFKIAGTIDAVFKNKKNEYVMVDWKRCKEIPRGNSFQASIVSELDHLPDCKFVRYSMQLNLYKKIVEKNYGIKISHMFIVNVHPLQNTFLEIKALDLSREMDIVLGSDGKKENKPSRILRADLSKGIKITGTLFIE
jgi:hypothetical protein